MAQAYLCVEAVIVSTLGILGPHCLSEPESGLGVVLAAGATESVLHFWIIEESLSLVGQDQGFTSDP